MKLEAIITAGFLLCIGLVGATNAQDAGRRAQDLVASLDKTKSKSKEKRGLKIEVYVDVKNEAVVKTTLADYSGTYSDESDMHRLLLNVSNDGRILGSGFDDSDEGKRLNFTLEDARIDGALLTGSKVYSNGRSEKFEAVFTNRTVKSGQNEKNASVTEKDFGVGYIESGDQSTSRIFLKRQ